MINIAVIPARGGSKRIPRKNIKLFHGKPIIAYSINAAIKSGLFDKVIVSTDEEEIAEIARKYGATVPFIRPSELSDDFTSSNDVVIHAINTLQEQGDDIDYVCCVYATSPFVQHEYLVKAHKLLIDSINQNFAFSVNKFSYPIQRSFTLETEKNIVTPLMPKSLPQRSQDLPDVYHDAGQFYLATAQSFLSGEGGVFSDQAIPIILPSYLVQDIDNEEDWLKAELMYEAMLNQNVIGDS